MSFSPDHHESTSADAAPAVETTHSPVRSAFRHALFAVTTTVSLLVSATTAPAEALHDPQEQKEKEEDFPEVRTLVKQLRHNEFGKRDTAKKELAALIQTYVQKHHASPPWKELLRPNEKTQDAELHRNLKSLWEIMQHEELPLIWLEKPVTGLPKPSATVRLRDFIAPLQRIAGDRSFVGDTHAKEWDAVMDPACTWNEGQDFWSLVHALRTKDGNRLTTIHDDAGNMTFITTKYEGPVAFSGPLRAELVVKNVDPAPGEFLLSKTRLNISFDSLPQIAPKNCHLTSVEVVTKGGRTIPCEIISQDANTRSGFVLEIPTLTKADQPIDVSISMDASAVPVTSFTVGDLTHESTMNVSGDQYISTIIEKEDTSHVLRLAVPGLATDFVLHSSCIGKDVKGAKLPRVHTQADGRDALQWKFEGASPTSADFYLEDYGKFSKQSVKCTFTGVKLP